MEHRAFIGVDVLSSTRSYSSPSRITMWTLLGQGIDSSTLCLLEAPFVRWRILLLLEITLAGAFG